LAGKSSEQVCWFDITGREDQLRQIGIDPHIRITNMERINGKVVAITGASSGIGEATARILAKSGARVVLGARRTDRLETLVRSIQADGTAAVFRSLDVTANVDSAF
jgi:NADPH:quinone reductase-like Zn-dependent oxidoreductase